MNNWTRRDFVKTAGATVAAAVSFQILPAWGQDSPNARIRHAVIGTGGRGGGHVSSFGKMPGCEVVAVCDVDPERAAKSAAGLPNAERVKKYDDYRKLLEDKSIDTISIATCDHWHTPVALAALVAGKHVYVEKPCSHNVHEANLLVKAAKQYQKCVQHGTQRRSRGQLKAAAQALRDGIIGKVLVAKAINHQSRGPIGRAPVSAPPLGVNYDLWLGPAPLHPFTKNRWHYNWHWFWDYGGGDIANDGVHQLDVSLWLMNAGYPKSIMCSGGQLFYDDDHETPDNQMIVYEYEKFQVIYEMRLFTPYNMDGHGNGNVFYGTDGRMDIARSGPIVTFKDGTTKKIDDAPDTGIMENFIAAVRANDPSKLDAPIEVGAISTNLCHLGNIGTRLGGQRIEYDPNSAKITKCGGRESDANALLRRSYRKGYELAYHG